MTAVPDLPAPAAVELGETGGAVRGISWSWPGADLALLLVHSPGADLDGLRWLADLLVPAGLSVLSIDLPGHGLSDGENLAAGPGGQAIGRALAELGGQDACVAAVVAEGESAGLLLQTEVASPPVAAIMLDPRPFGPDQSIAASWRLVPKLLLVPGSEQQPYAMQIVESTNAWTLEAGLHGFGGPARTETAETQLASLTLKFTLELAAYELAARRRVAGQP